MQHQQPLPSFYPSADSGITARQQIQARLAESIGHVLEQCRGKVPFDEASGAALLDALASPVAVHPAVYGNYFAAVRAILALADDAASEAAVAAALQKLLTAPFQSADRISIRPLSRAEFTETEENAFRQQFVTESLADEQILTLDTEAASKVAADIAEALDIVRTHAPRTFSEFENVVTEIVPSGGRLSKDGLEFGGCSSLERWGSILVNTSAMPTAIVLSEALIHEAAHNYLFGSSPIDFHLTNPPEERHRSPLRLDPRPLDGIYHATFVLARICFSMNELADSQGLDAASREEARERAASGKNLFWEGYDVLRAHADYTEQGASIMTAARDYMQSLGEPVAG